jgi:hypothetical protein
MATYESSSGEGYGGVGKEVVSGDAGEEAVVGGASEDVVGHGSLLQVVAMADAEICDSSNPTIGDCSLFPAVAAALAKVWKARPTDSYRWTSSLSSIE